MILLNHILLFILFAIGALTQYKQCMLDLFPLPQQCTVGSQQSLTIPDPCMTLFRIYGNIIQPHFFQITQFMMQKNFRCKGINMIPRNRIIDNGTINNFQYIVDIVASDSSLKTSQNTTQQTYIINMTSQSTLLYVATYVAYVRSLQTFIQLFKYNKSSKSYIINNLPLTIADQPRFSHRGIMIDTARHYLPYQLILQTIDSLAYNKMNVLHWHITDEDSFPLILDSHPQLAKFGAFSQQKVYTLSQVKNIVRYGMIRGVRIIPQLDTPGHAASWGLAPQNKDIACVIQNWGYWGGLDVTLTQTYNIVKDVFKQIIALFPDSYIHLGGDQVQLSCFKNITQFTKLQNISRDNLHQRYRKKQKDIINQLNNSKQTIYWVNQNNFKPQKNDVIHWWGGSDLPNTTAKMIISMYGSYYLDMGAGNIFTQPYGAYSTWLDLYNQNLANQIMNYTNKQNVLGGEVLLWSELSNEYTHMIKLWLRSSAFAERMWNPNIDVIKPRVLSRLNSQMKRLNSRGVPTAPIVSQKCQTFPQYC